MKEYLIIDLLESVISGEWGNEPSGEQDVFVLRTTNFSNNGKIDFSKEVVKRNIDEKKVDAKKLNYGDIIIEKSGGSIDQPVGRVVFYDLCDNTTAYLCNNFTSVLRPNTKLVNPKFLFCFLFYLYRCKAVLKFQNQTTGIINLKLDNYLRNSTISIPMLGKQEHIVKILDKAQSLIEQRKKAIVKLDELVQAVFMDIFGNPVTNPMGWEVQKLKSLSTKILSGNTPKGGSQVYVDKGIIFFRSQNIWKNRIELDDVAYIDEQTHWKMSQTSVKNRDILITKTGRINTENSSLGRAALFLGEDDSANINGHVYLVRLKKGFIHEFVLYILITDEYRDYIREVCVGGIDKRQINKEHLEEFPIIMPPIDLQQRFADYVRQIDKLKSKMQQGLKDLESNFQALLQKAFKGELKVKDGVAV